MESRKKKIVFNIILSVVCVLGGSALLNYVIGLVYGGDRVWLTLMIVGFALAFAPAHCFDIILLDKKERERGECERKERRIQETEPEGR